jgi:hypothetical protein
MSQPTPNNNNTHADFSRVGTNGSLDFNNFTMTYKGDISPSGTSAGVKKTSSVLTKQVIGGIPLSSELQNKLYSRSEPLYT